jgi:HEXXH motif-containing protein
MTANGSTHSLPISQFDAIAAGRGDAATIRSLLNSEHSRRLILLYELLTRLNDQPELLGPLPGPSEAWRLLDSIEARSGHALAAVLTHPQIGVWMSHAIRRIVGIADSDTPVWADAGHLYSVILASAIHAGAPVSVRVPVRRGTVALPTIGLVRLPGTADYGWADAEVTATATVFRVGNHVTTVPAILDEDGPHWWALRRVRSGSAEFPLDIALDDIDPYRDLAAPVEPRRLRSDVAARWRMMIDESWTILCRHHRKLAEGIGAGLSSITPLPDNPEWEVRSASTGDAFGAVVMSLPPDATTMAVTLVHEFQHTKLGGLLHLVDLIDPDAPAELYAPWRPDPRPASGLLQGVYAFHGITAFWAAQRSVGSPAERRLAEFEFAYARRQTWWGLRTLIHSRRANLWGRRMLDILQRELAPMLRSPVTSAAQRAAWAAFADHRASWRLRNLRVAPEWLDRATAAWIAGKPPPPTAGASSVCAASALWAPHRLYAYRAWLRTDVLDCPDQPLLEERCAPAETGYRDRIERSPADLDAWIGLGLALAGQHSRAEWRPLLHRPEIVHAVHAALAEAEVDDRPTSLAVSRWLLR